MPKTKTVPGHRLIISFPVKDPSKLRQLFPAGQPTRFLYFGVDFFKRNRLERQLGSSFTRIDIIALHDKVAREIRSEHIKWIDRLNRNYGKEVEWWFNPIASRNIYVSNLFQYSCYLEILKRIWDDSDSKPELIFVESFGLATAICEWAKRQGIEAQVIFTRLKKYNLLSCYFVSLLKFGYFVCTLLLRQIAAYISKKEFGEKTFPKGKLAIVDTFLHDFSVDELGVFHDINFPYLYEYLEKNGFQILVHPVLYGFFLKYFSIYKRMRMSSTHFIIPEDYLHLSDYIHILTYPMRAWRRKITADTFRNFNLSEIINEDHARGLGESSSLLAGLIYRLFLRLGRLGVSPQLIISWYENQVIDKALVAAVRQAFPQAQIIGAQIFIYSYNLMYLFPIQSEVEAGICPHILLEMSDHLCKYSQAFTKDIPCRPAASLRYAYIFKERQNVRPAKKSSTVLVLLPYAISESVEMLEMLKMGLNRIKKEARILIKCHPTYSPRDLQRAFDDQHWPKRFEFYQGALVDALKMASVVISSNSSAIVEAAAFGIPVIFLGRQTASNNNVLEDVETELIRGCFTENELITAINKSLNLTNQEIEQYKALGERILKLFFLPITDDTMLPFLGDAGKNIIS